MEEVTREQLFIISTKMRRISIKTANFKKPPVFHKMRSQVALSKDLFLYYSADDKNICGLKKKAGQISGLKT